MLGFIPADQMVDLSNLPSGSSGIAPNNIENEIENVNGKNGDDNDEEEEWEILFTVSLGPLT